MVKQRFQRKLSGKRAATFAFLFIPIFWGMSAESSAQIRLKAVGDMMLGSKTPDPIIPPDSGKAFVKNIAASLRGADIVFGNLEGALVTPEMTADKCPDSSRKAGRCYEFGMPEFLAPRLKELGFTVLNLDNNHAEDYDLAGYRNTQNVLGRLGFAVAPKKGYAVQIVGGEKIAIAAFGFSDESHQVSDIANAMQVVKELKTKFSRVFVSFHGGAEGKTATHVQDKTEMFYGENRGNLYRFAHAVIDAGADLVLGHGPHVVRALELYKNKLIRPYE